MADRKNELAQASEQGNKIIDKRQKKEQEKKELNQNFKQMDYSDDNLKSKFEFIDEYYEPSVGNKVRDIAIDIAPGLIHGAVKGVKSWSAGKNLVEETAELNAKKAATKAADDEIAKIKKVQKDQVDPLNKALKNAQAVKNYAEADSLKSKLDEIYHSFDSVNEITENAAKKNAKINSIGSNNKKTAKGLSIAINEADPDINKINEKALNKVYQNSIKSSEIGPKYQGDVFNVLSKELKYTEAEANSVIQSFIKNNVDNPDLLNLLAIKDSTTARHVITTAALAEQIAKAKGLPPDIVKAFKTAVLYHDTGKLSTSDWLLKTIRRFNKVDRLTMERHAEHGFGILEGDELKAYLARIHHPTYKFAKPALETNKNYESTVTASDMYEARAGGYRPYTDAHPHNVIIEDFIKVGLDDEAAILDYLFKSGEIEKIFDAGKKEWIDRGFDVLLDADDTIRAAGVKHNLEEYFNSKLFKEKLSEAIIENRNNAISEATSVATPWAGKTIAQKMLFGDPTRKEKYKGITAPNEILKAILTENLRPLSPLEAAERAGNAMSPSFWLSKFSPSYRDSKYQLNDIKQWIDYGLLNEEQKRKAWSLDPNNEKEVANTWKELIDSMPTEKIKYLFNIGY